MKVLVLFIYFLVFFFFYFVSGGAVLNHWIVFWGGGGLGGEFWWGLILTFKGEDLLEVFFEACSIFFVVFLFMVFHYGLVCKQIARSWPSGRFRLRKMRSTSIGERPARGFPSEFLAFMGG